MALILQAASYIHQTIYSLLHTQPTKSPDALRLGIIFSAPLSPTGIIYPAETHPDVILYGIACTSPLPPCRKEDKTKDKDSTSAAAAAAAKRYRFTKSYTSHEELLDDPNVDIIYISTPNALHYGLISRAIQNKKHVLCETPLTTNAEEARKIVRDAKERGVVIEEGVWPSTNPELAQYGQRRYSYSVLQVHWQFHPAAHTFRRILDSKRYGRILRTEAIATSTSNVVSWGDTQWRFDLGGGSAMYMSDALSLTRFSLHAQHPKSITSVSIRPSKSDPRVDEAMYAHLAFRGPEDGPTDVHSRLYTDMARKWPWRGPFSSIDISTGGGGLIVGLLSRIWDFPSIEVETEKAIVFFYNATMPHLYHYIAITEKETGKTHYEKTYVGGPRWKTVKTSMVTSTTTMTMEGEESGKGGCAGWSTWRYQLEAFVDAVKEKTPAYWVSADDSVWQMESVDAMYQAAGLPVRPSYSPGKT